MTNKAPSDHFENFEKEFIEECFINAIKEVISTVSCTYLDNIEYTKPAHDSELISGFVSLFGSNKAIIQICIDKNSASRLVSNMIGISESSLTNEDVYDGVAEIANMVAGMIKTFLAKKDYQFELIPPFIITGNDYSIIHTKSVPVIDLKFLGDNDVIMYLHFVLL